MLCVNESWQEAPSVVRQNIQGLLKVALRSRADSTIKTYVRNVKKFFRWCNEKTIPLRLPLHPATIAMYIHEVSRKPTSISALNVISAAIKWLHSLVPDKGPNPLDTEFCKTILQASKRNAARPINKKKPVSANIIREIIDTFGSSESNLKDLRTAAFCTLGFVGFFRFDELRAMQPNHIQFHEQYIEILIPRSKTDVYREGNIVYISKSKTQYCPVDLLLRYMRAAKIDFNSSQTLFRQVTFHKKTNTYSLRKYSLSYTSCREMFKGALKTLGYQTQEYGLHSLRSGGITEVVQRSNNEISERLLKLHGRWKTDYAKDLYVQESIKDRLKVTRCLNL